MVVMQPALKRRKGRPASSEPTKVYGIRLNDSYGKKAEAEALQLETTVSEVLKRRVVKSFADYEELQAVTFNEEKGAYTIFARKAKGTNAQDHMQLGLSGLNILSLIDAQSFPNRLGELLNLIGQVVLRWQAEDAGPAKRANQPTPPPSKSSSHPGNGRHARARKRPVP